MYWFFILFFFNSLLPKWWRKALPLLLYAMRHFLCGSTGVYFRVRQVRTTVCLRSVKTPRYVFFWHWMSNSLWRTLWCNLLGVIGCLGSFNFSHPNPGDPAGGVYVLVWSTYRPAWYWWLSCCEVLCVPRTVNALTRSCPHIYSWIQWGCTRSSIPSSGNNLPAPHVGSFPLKSFLNPFFVGEK